MEHPMMTRPTFNEQIKQGGVRVDDPTTALSEAAILPATIGGAVNLSYVLAHLVRISLGT